MTCPLSDYFLDRRIFFFVDAANTCGGGYVEKWCIESKEPKYYLTTFQNFKSTKLAPVEAKHFDFTT